jgi:ribosome-binding ATPase YchF (GTP1/OBG family)
VRVFESSDIIHVNGLVDPKSDIEIINAELIMADIESVQKRILSDAKKARSDKAMAQKVAVYEKVLDKLEQ